MFEYDRDITVCTPGFSTWECLWEKETRSVPISDQESICESDDLNVNSNWDFPPLGYHPATPKENPNPRPRDVKSYSDAVQKRGQSKELLEMEKSLSADGLDSQQKDCDEILKDTDTESTVDPEIELYTCEKCHGEVDHTDDCPTRRQAESEIAAAKKEQEQKLYDKLLCTNCKRQWNSMEIVNKRAQHCINSLPTASSPSGPGQKSRKDPAHVEWVILPVPCEPKRDPLEYPRYFMLVPAR